MLFNVEPEYITQTERTGDTHMPTKTNSIDEKRIGETIRRLRIRKGLRLEDIAKKVSLSPTSVRALELGRGSTITTLIKVLKAIDEVSFLIDWESKSSEVSPLQALRLSRKLSIEPKRVSRRKDQF